MSALSAVVFDVDGTLVDSERDGHRVAFNAAFEEAGLPDRWDVDTYGELLRVAGGVQRLTHWFEQHGRSASQARSLAKQLHPRKNHFMRQLIGDGAIGPRPGVMSLLDELEAAGVHLHVATTGSRTWVELLLDRVFGDRFRAVLTGTEIPDLKPSPAVYLAVLRVTGCAPEDTVAVEDSANGVDAAVAAGLRCIAVHNPYTRDQDLSGAALATDGFTDPALATWFRNRLDGRAAGDT